MATELGRELQQKRLTLASRIRELAADTENWSDTERANWAQLNSDYDDCVRAIDEEIKREEQAEQVQSRLADIEAFDKQERGDRRIGLDHQQRKAAEAETIRGNTEKRSALVLQARCMYAAGLDRHIRQEHLDACRLANVELGRGTSNGDSLYGPIQRNEFDIPLNRRAYANAKPAWVSQGHLQQRDLNVSTEPEVIPEGFSNELEVRMQAVGGLRTVCRVLRTATGNDIPWPTMTDVANDAAILAESTTIGASVDPTISSVTFNAYKYSSKPILVSSELVTDSYFDLAAELGGALGERIGRGTNAHFTTGTGTSQPRGVITAALADGTTVAADLAADTIITLVHSVDPAYRSDPSFGFMCHDSTVAVIRKYKDSQNQYLWQPGLQQGVPDRLYGLPLTVNQDMDDGTVAATGEELLLVGAFSKYIIRDAGPIRARVLTERFADLDQICFITFSRHDGDMIQGSAFAVNQEQA